MRATSRYTLPGIGVPLCLPPACLNTFGEDCVYRQKIAFYKTLLSLP